MKVLLVAPPADLNRSYGKLKKFAGTVAPLGLAYLGASLQTEGIEVGIFDAYHRTAQEVIDRIEEEDPTVVGMGVFTPNAQLVKDLLVDIRERFHDKKIILGNVHACLYDYEFIDNDLADVVVHHEGERTLPEVVKALQSGTDLGAVAGISYRSHSGTVRTPGRPFVQNLDELPFPAWDLVPLREYGLDARLALNKEYQEECPGLPIIGTRGCPHKCTFCAANTDAGSLGSKYRMRTPGNIVDELQCFSEQFKCNTFYLMDLSFPFIRRHAIQMSEEILSRNLEITWACECRADSVDLELLQLMRRAGCVRVNYGIESGNQGILDSIKKGFTLDDVRQAVADSRRAGMEIEGLFILGLPGETKDSAKDTIQFALELDLDMAKFNTFVPFPGSVLFDELLDHGKIRTTDWSLYSPAPGFSGQEPVYVPDQLTREELARLQLQATRRFFFQPRILWRHTRRFQWRYLKDYWTAFIELSSIRSLPRIHP